MEKRPKVWNDRVDLSVKYISEKYLITAVTPVVTFLFVVAGVAGVFSYRPKWINNAEDYRREQHGGRRTRSSPTVAGKDNLR